MILVPKSVEELVQMEIMNNHELSRIHEYASNSKEELMNIDWPYETYSCGSYSFLGGYGSVFKMFYDFKKA